MKLASFKFLTLLLQSQSVFSVVDEEFHPMPPNPNPYRVKYDDGSISPLLHLIMRGDETGQGHQAYEETLDGFTVKSVKGQYVYLEVDDDTGEYIETNLVAGEDDPYAARIRKDAWKKVSSATLIPEDSEDSEDNVEHVQGDVEYTIPPTEGTFNRKLRGAKAQNDQPHRRTVITSGTLKNLVIPFKFADHTERTVPSKSDLDILMNHEGANPLCPTGSVRDVYLDNSFGVLDLQSTVIDWITIDFTEKYCADGDSGTKLFHTCLMNALDKAVAAGVDFRDYDLDEDNFIDGIAFFHSGYGAEWGGTDAYGAHYLDRIWSHKWALSSAWRNNDVRVYTYHISPALWSTSGSAIGRIGVIAHETGHFLELPDLYDYGDGSGIGSWGLMANSWGFDGSQYYPPLMSAWAKNKLGWVSPTVVSTSGSYSIGQSCDNDDMIRIDLGFPSGQYLLIENRQPCSFDSRVPQGGLAIFYIDDNANNNRGYPGQSGWPGNRNHYEVALLQADGNYNLERGSGRGDSGDLFHGGAVNSIGSDGTSTGDLYPNTKPYEVDDYTIDLKISDISAAGSTMTLTISFGNVVTPSPVPITPAPTRQPSPWFCGDGVCQVTKGEGCGFCPSDCSFPTNCGTATNNGSAIQSSGTFGLVFDATVGSKGLYFYEFQVYLIKDATATIYMKNGSHSSDPNLDNWTEVFDGSISKGGTSRQNVQFQSRFFAQAGSTVAFYISYTEGAAFAYSRDSFANDDVTIQNSNALRQQTGNTIPSTAFSGRYLLELIRYDYGTGSTLAPVPSTPAPVPSTPVPSTFPSSPSGLQGTILKSGEQRTSPNGNVTLKYQTDGNLELYKGSTMLWASNTRGLTSRVVAMQGDGNLVVYSQTRAVFASYTGGNAGAKLYIQDDGKLVIKDVTGNQIWQSGSWDEGIKGVLLKPGEQRTSPNGSVSLKYQTDGNLELYKGSTMLWNAQSHGTTPRVVAMQGDGNLVVYSQTRAVFASHTGGNAGAELYIKDDGKLVIKDVTGNQIWAAV